MLTMTRLKRKPKHFYNFSGLTVAQFEEVLLEVERHYPQFETAQPRGTKRQRAEGTGRPYRLPLEDRLLLTLISLRLNLTHTLLGYLFNLDQSNVGREIRHRMRPTLEAVLPTPLRDRLFDPRPLGERPLQTLAELLERHPEFGDVFVDATEQNIPRPGGGLKQKFAYSGKQKTHTVKTQVATTDRRVIHTSEALPGSVADMTVLRASGVMKQIPQDRKIYVDKGYEGIEDAYPDAHIEKPFRAQRGHRLTLFGKVYNRVVGQRRVKVEHMLAKLEKFKVLAEKYRARLEGYEQTFQVVAGLVNFKALGSLNW